MHGSEIILLVVVMALGLAALAFSLLMVVIRSLEWMGTGVLRLFGFRGRRAGLSAAHPSQGVMCGNPQCRHVERRRSKFCPRCGKRFPPNRPSRGCC